MFVMASIVAVKTTTVGLIAPCLAQSTSLNGVIHNQSAKQTMIVNSIASVAVDVHSFDFRKLNVAGISVSELCIFRYYDYAN